MKVGGVATKASSIAASLQVLRTQIQTFVAADRARAPIQPVVSCSDLDELYNSNRELERVDKDSALATLKQNNM